MDRRPIHPPIEYEHRRWKYDRTCACVSTDVPADTLVAGVPAKVVKEFEDFAAVAQKE